MKNYIIIAITMLLASINLQAQKNEYMYFAIRFGVSNSFSGQPTLNSERYVYAAGREGEVNPQMRVQPSDSFFGYVPGANASILFHFDFVGDLSGLFTGIDYNFTGLSSQYETLNKGFTVVETHRMHIVGIPLAFKYGPDIWDTQRYLYLGGQINYIASVYTTEKTNWGGELGGRKLDPTEFNKTVFSIFAGFNWRIINLQIDFFPKSIFNENYEIPTDAKYPNPTPDSPKIVMVNPNEGQVKSFVKLTVGVNIPYGWLSERNFKIRRALLKFPWK